MRWNWLVMMRATRAMQALAAERAGIGIIQSAFPFFFLFFVKLGGLALSSV